MSGHDVPQPPECPCTFCKKAWHAGRYTTCADLCRPYLEWRDKVDAQHPAQGGGERKGGGG